MKSSCIPLVALLLVAISPVTLAQDLDEPDPPDDVPMDAVWGRLEPGDYGITIKFDHEDKKPIFQSAAFTIQLKEYAALPKMRSVTQR